MKYLTTAILLIVLTNKMYADYYDTGMIEWSQPNGIIFIGKGWGDEFAFQYETNTGYRFVLNTDGYYYYAILDSVGEFTASENKVNIDSPLAFSYKLERSAIRKTEIEAEIEAFNQEVENNRIDYLQRQASSGGLRETINLGVLFIDFSSDDHMQNYPSPFEGMLFSVNEWIGQPTQENNYTTPHPQNHNIYGSLRDYYWDQSQGQIEITGELINISGGHVDWIDLPLSKDDYHNNYSKQQFAQIAIQKAVADGWTNLHDYTYIIILYASDRMDGGALSPSNYSNICIDGSNPTDGVCDDGSEPIEGYVINETYFRTFGHIGVHAHELAHKIGAGDQYVNLPRPYTWSLMDIGSHNGGYFGNCPSGFSPYYRIDFGWVNTTQIGLDLTDFIVEYNYDDPIYYKVPIDYSAEYFIFENRLREGFDSWTPYNPDAEPDDPFYPLDPNDPNGREGGLLVWHIKPDITQSKRLEIEHADGDEPSDDGDPFPLTGNGQNFNDYGPPFSNSRLRDDSPSHIAINNIRWDENNLSSIVDINLDYQVNIITENTTWSGIVNIDTDTRIAGATLTIDPGTEIQIQNSNPGFGIRLEIRDGGLIQSLGTNNNTVTINSSPEEPWSGISVYDNSSLILEHTQVMNATNVIRVEDSQASGQLIFSTFEDASSIGVNSGELIISNCEFINTGALSQEGDLLDISESIFINSSVNISSSTSCNISNSLFESDGSGIGIQNGGAPMFLLNNVIKKWSTGIVVGTPSVRETQMVNNNIIVGCNQGIENLGGDPPLNYNAFWNNTNNGYLGDNEITNVDPMFVDEANDDYHLKWESLLIDAGDPSSDFSNEPQPNGDRINVGMYGNTSDATITTNKGQILDRDTVWDTDQYLSGDIIIPQSISLTINPGVNVYMVPDYDLMQSGPNTDKVDIVVNGLLIANGTVTQNIGFTSLSNNPQSGDWGTIQINSDQQNSMQYCNIDYATSGIMFSNDGIGLVEDSQVQNCGVGIEVTDDRFSSDLLTIANTSLTSNKEGVHIFRAGGRFEKNTISNNEKGVIIEQAYSYELIGNTIESNEYDGIYLIESSDGMLDGNIIQGNGETAYNIGQPAGGIFLHASSPILTNNVIESNYVNGLVAMNGSKPILNFKKNALNRISGNVFVPCPPGEGTAESSEILLFDTSTPFLNSGHNDIFDNQGCYLIYADDYLIQEDIDVTYNYWAEIDPDLLSRRFYPSEIFKYKPFDEEPNTGQRATQEGGEASTQFQLGLTQESTGALYSAKQTYKSLVSIYPDSLEAAGALARLKVCTQKSNQDFQTLQSYFDSLAVTLSGTPLAKTANQYSILCDVAMEDYPTAISRYEAILANAPSLIDSVYAVIDIGQVYLAVDTSNTGGSKKRALGTMPIYRPVSRQDYEEKVVSALSKLFGKFSSEIEPVIPKEYALRQNYPNPFNPVTNIIFDIPELSDVKLTIYDLLGREIKELLNTHLNGGIHTVRWDGKDKYGRNLSSGMYIYRINAVSKKTDKQYHETRKMVLIK